MEKYKVLIDAQEFHEKLLDLMTSEKIDDFLIIVFLQKKKIVIRIKQQ